MEIIKSFSPLISIVTIVYNGDKYIQETIDSVLNQTYRNFEYIIVDGGSTDNTVDIIKKNESRGIRWISESDHGIADAFNKGIKLAKGDLIGLINADDWYEPDALETMISKYAGQDTVLCGAIKLYNNTSKFNIKISSLLRISSRMGIWHPGMFVPKQVYDVIGLYDIKYKVLMDYDFVLRCYLSGINFKIFENIVANMRYGGVSNKLIAKSMKEACEIKNNYFPNRIKNYAEYLFYSLYYQLIIFVKQRIY